MHRLIAFASAPGDAASQALHGLALPNLAALLARLAPAARDDADALTLSPPHERAWAGAAGWHGADGCLPFAAHAAAADGVAVDDLAWGLVTPTHWHVGRDHVTLADPAALELTDAESRAAFDAVRALFDSAGYRTEWGAASRWYIAHPSLAALPCASLDRVVGRDVGRWMRADAGTPAALRTLQSELQLLLYPHPLNEARAARGALPLNSFWLSGCGRRQPVRGAPPETDDRLRAPLLAQDWGAWADAWRALDAGPVARLLDAARAGEPVALTLCGERGAHRFETAPRSLWQRIAPRLRPTAPQLRLEAL